MQIEEKNLEPYAYLRERARERERATERQRDGEMGRWTNGEEGPVCPSAR